MFGFFPFHPKKEEPEETEDDSIKLIFCNKCGCIYSNGCKEHPPKDMEDVKLKKTNIIVPPKMKSY